MIGSAAGAGVAVVVDDDFDRIGVVAEGVRRAVQVLHVAGVSRKVFKSASVPVRVNVPLPLPPTVTPPPDEADRLPPVEVLSVTVRLPPLSSRSLKLRADRSTLLLTSSVTVMSLGRARVGRIVVVAAIAMSRVCVLEFTSPSLTVKATVRVAVDGIVAGVGVGDAAQGRFVLGHRRGSGQRQRARAGFPDAGDPVLVDEG